MTVDDVIRQAIRDELASLVVPPREWLSPADVAEELGLDVSTIYDKIRRGIIPSHRFDGRTYVNRGELNETIASAPSAARVA